MVSGKNEADSCGLIRIKLMGALSNSILFVLMLPVIFLALVLWIAAYALCAAVIAAAMVLKVFIHAVLGEGGDS